MRFSIMVPVLNEEAVLEDQLIHLTRQCTHHTCEVLIVDGGSHDGTGEVAKRYGKVIAAPRGRATQMNAGAAAARGDVLMFLHADTSLPDNTFCFYTRREFQGRWGVSRSTLDGGSGDHETDANTWQGGSATTMCDDIGTAT